MTFCAISYNIIFKLKTVIVNFGATFGKFWLLLIPTSGHTASHISLPFKGRIIF